ncbi:serine/threonine protein kinase [Oceanimonas sp. MB9]|uniref:serine/threonine protein kinase n=1 Tax=Oceanimonas sp. MB9 TaxID=2588453 RepID=UPI0013F5B58E|nr:serine/threonine protein kinase [Oceanimonas sp. MB9]NHH99239.1 Serine/threonine protein kinase RdoA [Oceanimonas sp. MB9]
MDYYQLTPDVIDEALASVGIYVDRGLMALNSYENRVYRFQSESDGTLVAKFYRPERWSRAQIEQELDFVTAAAEQGVRVAEPLQRDDVRLFEFNGLLFSVWRSVPARAFEPDNLEQLEALGEQLARLHGVGETLSLDQRPQMTPKTELVHSRRVLEQQAAIPAALRPRFFAVLDELTQGVIEGYRPGALIGIHGDCHGGNLLWHQGPWLLDFDDCRKGPAVQDLWMMLSGDRGEQLMQLDTLLAGYENVREFNSAELALIEPLRASRMINYMAWLAARWSDPAFPVAFPWFNTEDYWQRQLGALTEQLQSLSAPPLSLTSWS